MEQTNWKPATERPKLHEGDCGWLVSAPVLGYCPGQILVVTLELVDEDDCAPCWYSNCSEHLNLGTKIVTHWAPLPDPPNLAAVRATLAPAASAPANFPSATPGELPACPFCKRSDLLGFEADPERGYVVVKCRACGCQGPSGRSETSYEAKQQWFRAAPAPAIVWPKEKSVKRRDDMSPADAIQVGIDESGDLQVSLWTGAEGYSSVEFCAGNGGGRSEKTRLALISLMVAMEADNAERPIP